MKKIRMPPTIPFSALPLAGLQRVTLARHTGVRASRVIIVAYRLRRGWWRPVRARVARVRHKLRFRPRSCVALLPPATDDGGAIVIWQLSVRVWLARERWKDIRWRRERAQRVCPRERTGICTLARRWQCAKQQLHRAPAHGCPRVWPAVRGYAMLRAVGIRVTLLPLRYRMCIARWAARHTWSQVEARAPRVLAALPVLPRAQMLDHIYARQALVLAYSQRARPEFQSWALAQAQAADVQMRIDDYGIVVDRWLLVGRGAHSAALELPPRLAGVSPRVAVAWTFRRQPQEYRPEVEQ